MRIGEYQSMSYEQAMATPRMKLRPEGEDFSSILGKVDTWEKTDPEVEMNGSLSNIQSQDYRNMATIMNRNGQAQQTLEPDSPSTMDSASVNESNLAPISEKARELFKLRISWKARELGVSDQSDQDIKVFQNIMFRAQESGGYNDPKEFLRSLSTDEMEIVRKVQSLADPIDIEGLDTEGAYNLLLPDDMSKDLNNDGFLRTGLAWRGAFPPPNAPEGVKKAWEEATAGMSEWEKGLAMSPFMAAEDSFNLKYNAKGEVIGSYGPWDSEYQNIYAKPGFSYQEFADLLLSNLEIGKGHMKTEDYLEDKALLEKFKESLIANNCA